MPETNTNEMLSLMRQMLTTLEAIERHVRETQVQATLAVDYLKRLETRQ